MATTNFTVQDAETVGSAVDYLTKSTVNRMDIDLTEGKKAKVYWAGTVLRVDIEGLQRN